MSERLISAGQPEGRWERILIEMSISEPAHTPVLHLNRTSAISETRQSPLSFVPGSKGWQQVAACRGIDASIFFPEDENDDADIAKKICGHCPVAQPCLEYAITVREKDGVWGGATQRERRSIIRRRRRAAARQRSQRELGPRN